MKRDAIPIPEEENFLRRAWTVQRIGWIAIGALVLLALLGVFGGGPLSHATRADALLRIEFERFIRARAPASLRLQVLPRDGRAEIWLSRDYLDGFELKQVTPEPERVEASTDRFVYSFSVSEGSGPIAVVFHLEPKRFGTRRGGIGTANGSTLHIQQFIYP